MGKFLAIATVGVATALLNLLSMLATLASGALDIGVHVLAWRIPVVAVVALIPLVALFSALLVGLGVRATSFKEAQSTLVPLQFAVMLPAAAPLIPGVVFGYGWALVPVANIALLVRGVLLGDVTLGPAILSVVVTAVYAAVALAFAIRKFRSETIVVDAGPLPRSINRGGTVTVLRPQTAMIFVIALILATFFIGGPLQARSIIPGLLVTEYGLLALPALILASRTTRGYRHTLGLRLPTARAAFGGLVLWAGAIPLILLLTWLQSKVLPIPRELAEALSRILTARDAWHLAGLLFVAALTPAICEELVFRGVLMQSFRGRGSALAAITTSAIFFGAAHVFAGGLVRLLPSTLLGLTVGYAAWMSRSIVTGMLMHAINNSAFLVLLAHPDILGRYEPR